MKWYVLLSLLCLIAAMSFVACAPSVGGAREQARQSPQSPEGGFYQHYYYDDTRKSPPGTATAPTRPNWMASRAPLGEDKMAVVPSEELARLKSLPYVGSKPAPGEELWVISRADNRGRAFSRSPARDNVDAYDFEAREADASLPEPTTGELRAQLDDGELVPVPLKRTSVEAGIAGYIATVDVTQQFHNPFAQKIEAVYVFPLPENAAVNEFLMTIGERRIRGIIREKQEAERIYHQARAQGHVASLLTQQRPNIFTQKVANIEPQKQIDINIKYFHTLRSEDGWYEFVFPMVVGPRYNPVNFKDGIGAKSRAVGNQTGQPTEVAYLGPNEQTATRIGLQVQLDAGVSIEDIRCVNHRVEIERPSERTARVAIAEGDDLPNKDFVLRYQLAGDAIKPGLLTHVDQRGGFFTLMLHPPEDLRNLQRGPMEMIFVLDCSGSMRGKPLGQAKAAVREALQMMRPQDSFQIIRFSNNASQLGEAPLVATKENIARGLKYLRDLNGGGGTQMIEGIKAALDFPHDPERLRTVTFMTDGFIGNEAQILKEVHDRLGASRIFSFGVGSSPNRHLLDGLARVGRGSVAYLSLNDDAGKVMKAYFERVSYAALTNIEVDWGGMQVSDMFPRQIPDLFVGRPVVVTGRFRGQPGSSIRIHGKAGGADKQVMLLNNTQAQVRPGLPSVWAREQIAQLMFDGIQTGRDMTASIRKLALEYGLMSAYTAFVAVDSLERTAGAVGTTVEVPVLMPEGVSYETTVE